MLKERAKEVALLSALADMALVWPSFLLAYAVRFGLATIWSAGLPDLTLGHALWLAVVSMPCFYVVFAWSGLYSSMRTKAIRDLPLIVGKGVFFGGLFLGAAIFLVQAKYFSRSLFALFLTIHFLVILSEKIAIRISQRYLRRKGFNYRTVLIVGINEQGMRIADALRENREFGL